MSHNILVNAAPPADLNSAGKLGASPSLTARLGPKKFRTRLFLLVTFTITAVSAFYLVYFPSRLESRLARNISDMIRLTTSMAAQDLSMELRTNDRAALDRILKSGYDRSSAIQYAVLEDASGLVLASFNRDIAEQDLYRETDPVEPPAGRRSIYRTKTPIMAEDRVLGSLYLGFSFRSLIAETTKEKGLITFICLALVLVSGALVFFFSGLITRPLAQVTRTAEKIAKGDLEQRARVYSHDEMGVLARTFNAMVDSLEKTLREKEGINKSLEDMMRARSAEKEKEIGERRRVEMELRLAREELEHRVEKRTEELSKVNEELSGRVIETRRAEDQLQNTLERLERALEGTVQAMSLTIEMRDLYAAGHQRRVASLAVAIAEELHLPSEKIEGLRLAAIIHDIGKIAMPAELLTKPSRLSRNEFQLVRDHPRIGFEILKNIEFPWPVAHIILQHHERMDGTGYPEGLLGDAILIEARILAVADVVEALSSHRPYRPAIGIEKALEEIRRGRGIRYDMRVADACMKLFKDRRYSFKNENAGVTLQ
jgi:putative nucleotidyltransferase with HDIG domain